MMIYKIKRSIFTLISSALFGLCLITGDVQELKGAEESPKLAVLDMQKALQSVEAGKEALKKLQDTVKSKRKKFKQKKKEIQELQKKFQKQSLALNQKARMKKQKEIRKKAQKLQREAMKTKAQLRRKEQQLKKPIVKKIRKVVQSLSEEKGYSKVLDSSSGVVVYHQGKDDITDEVIKKYNKRFSDESDE